MKLGLSPMDGVTDAAMRYMTAKYSQPDFLITEFVSVDALHFATGERRERLLKTFKRAQDVAPLQSPPKEIAQIFGHTVEYFKEAAELIESLGFDGIDINMGCPAHKVEEQGSGAGLIRTPEIAKEIVRVVKATTKLPVSVKTRIGVDSDMAEEWMAQLMEVKPAMISLHGRTLRQLYSGQADWGVIERAAKVVHKYGGVIMGNGDVQSVAEAQEKADRYGVDGVLIGRAAEGNPAIFISHYTNTPLDHLSPSKEQRLAWMVEHARVFEQIFAERVDPLKSNITLKDQPSKWFFPMRKHLAWYCKGFEGAVEMRCKLMLTTNSQEVEEIIGR